jgi:hypothetical protein
MARHFTVECPHCYTRVLPMENNICPACKMDMSDTYDVDPQLVSLTVRESDDLPPYCYLCNSYTDRYVKIVGDTGTLLDKSLSAVVSLVVPILKIEEGTSNVFVRLPQCETCAELEEPSPIHVDYENQAMTFVVNKGFKERVQPTPIDTISPDDNETSDEENIE